MCRPICTYELIRSANIDVWHFLSFDHGYVRVRLLRSLAKAVIGWRQQLIHRQKHHEHFLRLEMSIRTGSDHVVLKGGPLSLTAPNTIIDAIPGLFGKGWHTPFTANLASTRIITSRVPICALLERLSMRIIFRVAIR